VSVVREGEAPAEPGIMRAQQELRPPCGLSRAEFNIVKVVTTVQYIVADSFIYARRIIVNPK